MISCKYMFLIQSILLSFGFAFVCFRVYYGALLIIIGLLPLMFTNYCDEELENEK